MRGRAFAAALMLSATGIRAAEGALGPVFSCAPSPDGARWTARGQDGRSHAVRAETKGAEYAVMVMRDRPPELDLDIAPGQTLGVNAPPEWTIVSGWGGVSRGSQEIRIPPRARDTALAAGRALHRAASADGAVQVVQYFGAEDVARTVMRLLETLARSYGEALRSPPGGASVIVAEPTGGGNWTDGAMLIGYDADFAASPPHPALVHHLAHELFHAWLPWRFDGDAETTAWFHEGFTDYISLRRAAREGLVSRAFFAERLLLFERLLEGNPAWGRTAFADVVDWRREPQEELAYKGGALLALCLDAALAKDGARIEDLLRDALADPSPAYDLGSIRAWLEGHGLREQYRRHIAGSEKPPVRACLRSAGFVASPDGSVRVDEPAAARFLAR